VASVGALFCVVLTLFNNFTYDKNLEKRFDIARCNLLEYVITQKRLLWSVYHRQNVIFLSKKRDYMRCAQTIIIVILSVVTVSQMGCFSSNPKDIEAFIKPYEANVTANSYVLQPPDEIEIHCSKVPEIHLQKQQIRPDGKVSFEGVGEIEAAGKTPEEVADTVRAKVLELYALTGDKPIDVRVTVYRSKVFYVLGQVFLPGPKVYTGRNDTLSAIAAAQPNPMAWLGRIQIIRPSYDKKIRPKIFELNLDRMMAHGDASKNVLLQEGDIIYVPPTVLAAISLKVEEFVTPIGRAFSTVYIGRQAMGPGEGGGF
jgi:polysaccharide export outer membrane protein